jgi:hypothetical protein
VGVAVALLAAVFVTLAATSIAGKSLTHDEGSHYSYGEQVLHRHTFQRLVHQHNATSPWMAVNAAAAAVTGAPSPGPLSAEALRPARLATLLFGVALGLVVFAWAAEAHGAAAALLALALHAFSPNLLAHSRLVTTDALTALAVTAALWTLWRFHRRRTPGRLVATGAALGLAWTTKATAVWLVPVFALLEVARWLLDRKADRRGDRREDHPGWRRWADLALIGLLGLVVLNAVHLFEGTLTPLSGYALRSERFTALAAIPGLASLPLPLPRGWVEGLDWLSADVERGRWSYLLGHFSREGFPHYYLVAFLVKSTPAFLGLLALAAAARSAGWGRRPPESLGAGPDSAHAALYLLLPAAFFTACFSLAFPFQIGIRHLLPVYPLLWILVSPLAVAPRRWLAGAAWALVGLHAASALAVHPHYLAYFNELAGGPERGWRYLNDSNIDWGQDRALARHVWAPASPVPVIEDPGGPVAGRILLGANTLVGLTPAEHRTYAWLRDGFRPVASIGGSWLVYDVRPEDLERCCADSIHPLPEAPAGLHRVTGGRPLAGAGGLEVVGLDRLADGLLGSGTRFDAATTLPPRPRPVTAWFGLEWDRPVVVSRLVAYPSMAVDGPHRRRFEAREATFEVWRRGRWEPVEPGRVRLDGPRVEADLEPIATHRVRLVVTSQRNHRGLARDTGRFRAACLEVAAYGPG